MASSLPPGLEQLRQQGHGTVILLGHPSYYPRHGFRPAREFDLHYENDRDAFMAIELYPRALDNISGQAVLAPEFNDVQALWNKAVVRQFCEALNSGDMAVPQRVGFEWLRRTSIPS